MHEAHVWAFALKNEDWFTAADVARGANLIPRTARHLLLKLFNAGLLDRRRAYGGFRYHRRALLDARAAAYLRHLEDVKEAFEIQRPSPVSSALSSMMAALAFS